MKKPQGFRAKIKCPKCNLEMKVIKVNGSEIDECPGCAGIWVDYFEEKEALKMEPAVFTIDELHRLRKIYKPLGRLEKVRYFKCPHCHNLMWRKNYMKHSGIIVDKCRDHGTFFDKGELEKAIEFIKKGGAEYQKLLMTEIGLQEVNGKLVREINRVETNMYRLHWVGRFLSLMGF